MEPLAGKVAMVTNAERGLGRATALRLAALGARVAVHYSCSRQDAEQVTAEIRAALGHARPFYAQLAEAAQVRNLFTNVDHHFGGVDILVHTSHRPAPLLRRGADEGMGRAAGDAPTPSCFLILAEAARRVRSGGRIITLNGCAPEASARSADPRSGALVPVDQMVMALAEQLDARCVTANALLLDEAAAARPGASAAPDARRSGARIEPKPGRLEEITSSIAFLSTDEARFITGQVLRLSARIAA